MKYGKIVNRTSIAADSATEIFRTEVVANDSDPEFSASFRFQPQAEAFKDHKSDTGPAPATLSFEFYDSRMRDAYRDSKSLQPKPADLLGKVDVRLDEIFQPFVDLIADHVFAMELESNANIKGHRHYREDFIKSVREQNDEHIEKLKRFLRNASAPTISNFSWSIDRELSVPSSSTMSLGRSTSVFCGKFCSASSSGDAMAPYLTLHFVCIPSPSEKDQASQNDPTNSAMKLIESYMSPTGAIPYDFGFEYNVEDSSAEVSGLSNPNLQHSNLIPFRASDTPSIKQQVQRYRENQENQVGAGDNVAKRIEMSFGEFKGYISLYPQPKLRTENLHSYGQDAMKALRTTAFKNPRLFYGRGPVGEPYTVYGFLYTLHTFRDQFETLVDGISYVIDFWQILSVLKIGLLRSLLEILGDPEKEDSGSVSILAELTRRYNIVELQNQLLELFKTKPEETDYGSLSDFFQTKLNDKVDGFAKNWIDQFQISQHYCQIKNKPQSSDVPGSSKKANDSSNDSRKDSAPPIASKSDTKSDAKNDFLKFMDTNVLPVFEMLFKHTQKKQSDIICSVECEFQWLLSQEYSSNIFSLDDVMGIAQSNSNDKVTPINEYSGENVLHLLIIRGNLDSIRTLSTYITCKDYRFHMMNAKVTGRFFCPVYGEVQYGQTPMHFAVSTGQIDVVKHLLKEWCNDDISRYFCLWEKDTKGNSVLHLCVIKNLAVMYDFLEFCMNELEKSLKLLEWWHREPRLTVSDDDCMKNYHYNTPIELAAILGNQQMLAHLINKEKAKNLGWSYGSATLSAMRVRDIDSYKTLTCPREPDILSDDRLHSESTLSFLQRKLRAKIRSRSEVEPSVLSILIERGQKQLLNIPVIQGLIDFKWITFVKELLSFWILVSLAIFVLFEIVCYNIIYPATQEGLAKDASISFSTLEVVLYIIAIIFLLWRQYFQFEIGIAMQRSESTFATFDPEAEPRPKTHFVYPSQPSWKLGTKVREALAKQQGNPTGKVLEKLVTEMLGHKFRTSQIQPYIITQKKSDEEAGDSREVIGSNIIAPLSIISKLLWRVTFQDMINEGGLMGVAWAILVLLSAVIRLAMPSGSTKLIAEQVCLALASVCIFFYMTVFYSFSDKLGPFLVLLQHMFMDLAKWLSITLLFFLGYAQAMLMITSDTSISVFGTYKWLLGDSSTDELSGSDIIQGVIIFLFISYSILVSISLVNILTAMFGSTYSEIMANAKETWFLEYFPPLPFLYQAL